MSSLELLRQYELELDSEQKGEQKDPETNGLNRVYEKHDWRYKLNEDFRKDKMVYDGLSLKAKHARKDERRQVRHEWWLAT